MHLGQMALKIYKNTLCFNSTSIFTQSLKEFSFYFHQKIYFNNLHSILKSQEYKDFSNRKILVSPPEKNETWNDTSNILKCNSVSAMLCHI